jgi:hypothetical protein
MTGKRNVKVLIGRLYVHSGNEDDVSCMFSTQDATLQYVLFNIHQDHVSSVTETLRGIKVAEKHKGTARFQGQAGEWKASGSKGVKIFNGIYVFTIDDLVSRHEDLLLSWKSSED